MWFRYHLKESLRTLREHESAVKASARNILLLKTLADADPAAPVGIRKGLAESLKEHREELAALKDLRDRLPEQYIVADGGDC